MSIGLGLIVGGLLALTSQTHASEGLWAGIVTVNAVSEVNKTQSDLSFDLQLEGTLLEEDLIAAQSTWRYHSGTDQQSAWRETSFDDSDDSIWSSGAAPLGYGANQNVATLVDFGADPDNKYPTSYFRQTFEIKDASVFTALMLRYRRDDGIAIYMNGQLVLNNNLPASSTNFNSLALTPVIGDETVFQEVSIPSNILVNGTNLVAVEIHIASADDEDMGFDLALVAQREASTATLISAREADWRYQDNGEELLPEWREIDYAEPGWKNGAAQLGYPDNDNATKISSGPRNSETNPVTYFRKHFNVDPEAKFSHLNVSLMRDDGAVVYLNGQELLRSNMPSGEIGYLSPPVVAVTGDDENRYYQQLLPSSLLQIGSNVIAVEVHQHATELTPFEGAPPITPTARPMSMRLLLHEDSAGNVMLLKQVILMWQDGSFNANGTLAEKGHYVLLTDDTLIPQFKGVGVRDSTLVGKRISAVGFDFVGNQTAMDAPGTLDVDQTVSGTFTIPGNHPTHPRRHRFNPEHDNLNAIYSAPAAEVGAIERTIILEISARYPPDPNEPVTAPPPGWGDTRLGGIYHETFVGLHRLPIKVTGVFTLERISPRGALNE